jgi:hypothetical protein
MASDFAAFVARHHTGYENVERVPDATNGAAIITGSLVFVNVSDGELELCGADPAAILGIATGPYASRTLYPGNKLVVHALTSEAIVFMCSATTPSATDLQVEYGVSKLASLNWSVDTSDTTNKRVQVVDYSTTFLGGGYFVKFLPAALQADAVVS